MKKCPNCKGSMYKAGFAWSGKKKVQRWKCINCGRTTIITGK